MAVKIKTAIRGFNLTPSLSALALRSADRASSGRANVTSYGRTAITYCNL
jgi:hypothetical protein